MRKDLGRILESSNFLSENLTPKALNDLKKKPSKKLRIADKNSFSDNQGPSNSRVSKNCLTNTTIPQ